MIEDMGMEMEPEEKTGSLMGEEDIFAKIDGAHGAEEVENFDGKSFYVPSKSLLKFEKAKGKIVSSRGTLQWFRLQCPGWSVLTEIISESDSEVAMKATVIDTDERIRSTGYKKWSKKKAGTGQFAMECAETGAINRALNNLGFLSLVVHQGFDPDGGKPYWEKEKQ